MDTAVALGYWERSHITTFPSYLVAACASAAVNDTDTVSPDMLPSVSRGASYAPAIFETYTVVSPTTM